MGADATTDIAIIIRSHHCDVPDVLRAEIERKVARLHRHFTAIEQADVTFTHETDHHRHGEDLERCEIVVRGHGRTVRASARGRDLRAAAERVVDKLDVNLARAKSKLVERSQPRRRPSLH